MAISDNLDEEIQTFRYILIVNRNSVVTTTQNNLFYDNLQLVWFYYFPYFDTFFLKPIISNDLKLYLFDKCQGYDDLERFTE